MSNNPCGKASSKVNAVSDYIDNTYGSDTRTLFNMLQLSTDGDIIPGYLKAGTGEDGDPINDIDTLVSVISDKRFTSIEALDSSTDEALKASYGQALKIAVSALYNGSNDPSKLMAAVGQSSRLESYLKMQVALEKGSTFVRRVFNAPLRLFGNPENIEFFSNRPTILRLFQPSKEVFYEMSKLSNFVNSYNSRPIAGVHAIMDHVSKNDVFKSVGITREVFSKIFPMFDKQLYENAGGDRIRSSFAETLAQYKVGVTEEQAAIIHDEFIKVRDELWYQVNYGKNKITIDKELEGAENRNQKLIEIATDGSVLGNMRIMLAEIKSMYAKYKDTMDRWENPAHVKAIESVMEGVLDFHAREGYIPGNGPEKISFSPLSEGEPHLIFSKGWLEHRSDEATFDQGDFFNGAITNIQGAGIQLDETARIIGYNAVDVAMKEHSDWFRANNERREVFAGLRAWLHDQRLIIDSPASQEQYAAKLIKRASAMAGLIPAMILFNPGSSLNNSFAGAYNMMMAVGKESSMGKFTVDLQNGNELARTINEYADKFMVSPGLVSEFEAYSPLGQKSAVGDKLLTWVQQAADKMGEGIFGVIPGLNQSTLWKQLFGMKGSENRLREHVKAIVYNRISDYLGSSAEAMKRSVSDPDYITSLIKRYETDAWYDITQALGDFSPTSKPFWAHTLGDTANTPGMALLGAFLKFAYVFRHPMQVNLENFSINLSKSVAMLKSMDMMKSLSPYARSSLQYAAAAGGVGVVMAMTEFFRDAILADRDSIVLPFTETLNPLQEYRNPLNLFYSSIVAPLFGLRVSEEAHREIVASNVAFVANLMGGKGLGRAIKEDGGANIFMTRARKLFDLPEIMYELAMNPEVTRGNIGKLYDKRQQLRDASADLTSADPLWYLERGFELAFIRDPNNPDKVNSRFASDTISKSLASIMGLSVWRTRPEFVRKSYGSHDYEREYGERNSDYVRMSGGSRGRPYNNAASSMLNSMRRYGRTYAPKPENIIGYQM